MALSVRSDALLNEYKGNLFEFLVAKTLASHFEFEDRFLSEYETSSFDTLMQQEDFIRNYYPAYLDFLPYAANLTAMALIDRYKISNCSDVWVIGKKQAAQKEEYDEADLIIYGTDKIKCSLKFSRASSFVNTKSAGIRSFFKSYFASNLQESFNRFWDLEWDVFARKMHELADLEYSCDFTSWKKSRSEVLPGELTGDFQDCLHHFYSVITKEIYDILLKISQENKKLFISNLYPLMGFSHVDIKQVCFFYDKNEENYKDKEITIHAYDEIVSKSNEELEVVLKRNNIEIKLSNVVLQIRLKPMNTFVNKGYKVNCSVKFS